MQGSPATLLATATSLDDALVKLQALETGTAGVLLRTDDPAVVRGPRCRAMPSDRGADQKIGNIDRGAGQK